MANRICGLKFENNKHSKTGLSNRTVRTSHSPAPAQSLLLKLSNVAYWHFIGHQSHHGVVAGRGCDLRPCGPPGGLVLAAVHSNSQEEHPSQETDDEAHVDGKC